MQEKKTKEQLLKELLEMQKEIEERVEEQDELIHKFQLLTQYEGLFSQVIGNFPYPIAVFERNGVLTMANQAMMQKACIKPGDIDAKKINLLSRSAAADEKLVKAAETVFSGETTLIQSLADPLTMFAGAAYLHDHSDGYQKAVFFPVFTNSGNVTHGVVMLMK
jgi:PAS domain-containing protein